jgi:hypothetical protein
MDITSALIDDDEAIQSMTLPNLRYLNLTHSSKIKWVSLAMVACNNVTITSNRLPFLENT